MSRVEEVENSIRWAMSNALAGNSTKPDMAKITRTLAAEVDELQRRLDAVVAMLEPGEKPKYCSFDIHRIYRELYKEWEWKTSAHARAVAIAEGRDNA